MLKGTFGDTHFLVPKLLPVSQVPFSFQVSLVLFMLHYTANAARK
jgi:hypothetical protein